MNPSQKAHFLLAFVQQVVPYGSDYTKIRRRSDIITQNRPSCSTTADCEDKTFLLASLVREIAGLESVALFYEKDEHLSIGIEIPDYEDAYSFKYKGKRYVACEPTANLPRLGRAGIPLERVTRRNTALRPFGPFGLQRSSLPKFTW